MQKGSTLVIIPTFNERENLPLVAQALFAACPHVDLLIVDDASPDGTADLADELRATYPSISVMRRTGVRGLGRSYVDGYRQALDAGYATVVQMDADLSHDPAYIPAMLEAARAADVVLGSRYCHGGGVRNWPAHRYLISRFANLYVAAITGVPTNDSTSGFRCYTQRALKQIAWDEVKSNGYAFQVEMTYRALRSGLRIAEVPIVFTDRTLGRSKMSKGVILESMVMPWRLRFRMDAADRSVPRSQGIER